MSEKSGFGSFFVGFLAGAVAGAIATILYAPNSGEETRESLKNKKDDLLGKANISVDDAYKAAETAAKEARDRFENLAAATRNRAEDITRRGQVILEEQINNFKKSNIEEKVEEAEEILMAKEEEPAAAEETEQPEAAETPLSGTEEQSETAE